MSLKWNQRKNKRHIIVSAIIKFKTMDSISKTDSTSAMSAWIMLTSIQVGVPYSLERPHQNGGKKRIIKGLRSSRQWIKYFCNTLSHLFRLGSRGHEVKRMFDYIFFQASALLGFESSSCIVCSLLYFRNLLVKWNRKGVEKNKRENDRSDLQLTLVKRCDFGY